MVVLFLVLDLDGLSKTSRSRLHEGLLDVGNLVALSTSADSTAKIGLAYVHRNSSESHELEILQSASGAFDLRGYHNAMAALFEASFDLQAVQADPQGPCNREQAPSDSRQVSSLAPLVRETTHWHNPDRDGCKIVFFHGGNLLESPTTAEAVLKEAANRMIQIEFIRVQEQEISGLDSDDFACSLRGVIQECENCTISSTNCDKVSLARLAKRCAGEVCSSGHGHREFSLCLPGNGSGKSNLRCIIQQGILDLEDTIEDKKTCRCHGLLVPFLHSEGRQTGAVLQELLCPSSMTRTPVHSDEASSAVLLGKRTLLHFPSFRRTPFTWPTSPGDHPSLEATKLVRMDTLDDSILFGSPYWVMPSLSIDDESDDMDEFGANGREFVAFARKLYREGLAVLCKSSTNLETSFARTAFPCYYVLLPLESGAMELKRVAAAEEIAFHPENMESLSSIEVGVADEERASALVSALPVEDYNPLKHERGLHSTLKQLAKESVAPKPPEKPILHRQRFSGVALGDPPETQGAPPAGAAPASSRDGDTAGPPSFLHEITNRAAAISEQPGPTQARPSSVSRGLPPLGATTASERQEGAHSTFQGGYGRGSGSQALGAGQGPGPALDMDSQKKSSGTRRTGVGRGGPRGSKAPMATKPKGPLPVLQVGSGPHWSSAVRSSVFDFHETDSPPLGRTPGASSQGGAGQQAGGLLKPMFRRLKKAGLGKEQ